MGLINKMTENIRNGLRNFLNITPASEHLITLKESEDYLTACVKNRVWYAGKSNQLSELYRQLDVSDTMFWKAPMTKGMEIRKIHTGLPAIIVDTLAQIVINDYNGIEITSENTTLYSDKWKQIEQSNENFNETLKTALTDIGIVGDGALKYHTIKAFLMRLLLNGTLLKELNLIINAAEYAKLFFIRIITTIRKNINSLSFMGMDILIMSFIARAEILFR